MSQGKKVPCEAFHINRVAGNITVSYERTVYTTTEGQGMVELCAVVHVPFSQNSPGVRYLPFAEMNNGPGFLMQGSLKSQQLGIGHYQSYLDRGLLLFETGPF